MYPETLEIMGQQEPYFRTEAFSETMVHIEENFKAILNSPKDSRFSLITGSGTLGMEAAVTNLFEYGSGKAAVICSGGFGERFVDLCSHWKIETTIFKVPFFEGDLDLDLLDAALTSDHTALFVQACETSSGRKFDLQPIGDLCRRKNILLCVDAVSGFLADPIDMAAMNIDVLITASQKALALAPDLAPVMCSPAAAERIGSIRALAPYYIDLKSYFENQLRGQTPFTCAVSSVLALSDRLHRIARTGVAHETQRHAQRAQYFRTMLPELGFTLPDIPLSNCCTPLIFENGGARTVYEELAQTRNLVLCPSGGANTGKILRVGHMGNLKTADYDTLARALSEVCAGRR